MSHPWLYASKLSKILARHTSAEESKRWRRGWATLPWALRTVWVCQIFLKMSEHFGNSHRISTKRIWVFFFSSLQTGSCTGGCVVFASAQAASEDTCSGAQWGSGSEDARRSGDAPSHLLYQHGSRGSSSWRVIRYSRFRSTQYLKFQRREKNYWKLQGRYQHFLSWYLSSYTIRFV